MAHVTVIDTPGEQPPVEAAPVAAEAVAEAAVEIAQIEADRDVAIAEIHAELEQQTAELEQQTAETFAAGLAESSNQEQDEWRRNIEAQMASLQETQQQTLSILQALQNPSPNPPQPPEGAADPQAQEKAAPEPPKPKRRPHHTLI